MPYTMITQCTEYHEPTVRQAIQDHLEQIPNLSQRIKSGDRVLIKPNFIAPKGLEKPTQTHPSIILSMARLLKEYGAHPLVGDSPAWGSAHQCAKALGLLDPLQKIGVPLITLHRGRLCKIGSSSRRVLMSIDALEADAVMNLPKFKAHQQLTATLAVKNMFGCVVGKQKPYWHYAQGRNLQEFGHFLLDICQKIDPMFTLIDAVVAMQGQGPINGDPYPMGLLISGTDPLACEATCVSLLQQPSELFPILQAAKTRFFPTSAAPNITWPVIAPGDYDFRDFKMPAMIPLRFTLSRVIKSVVKGLKTQMTAALT